MTDLIFYFLAAISSILASLYLWRSRQWSDDDHYALVQKYSDAASALTAMKAELDKLQEQLEFSEDVRYTLGMDNAKMSTRIHDLEREGAASASARLGLMRTIGNYSNIVSDAFHQNYCLQRSLRIARHKEFKAWKKRRRWVDQEWWPVDAPATWHNAIRIRRDLACPGNMEFTKNIIREYISEIRTMDPYPLP